MADHRRALTALPVQPTRLAVLVSGRGSNLQAVLHAIKCGGLHAEITGVFSDRCDAPALDKVAPAIRWAAAPSTFSDRDAFEAALTAAVALAAPDWVLCAGYMRLLKQPFIARFAPRIINIHPSLLPKYKGLHTHRRALAAHDRFHGASIHVVTPQLDAGCVLSQVTVPILTDDTEDSLAARVLAVEHPLLIATLSALIAQRLQVTLDGASFDNQRLSKPLSFDVETLTLCP